MNDNNASFETYFDDYNPNYTDASLNQTFAVKFANAVYFYYTPLLVFLGSIGNLVSVFVFYRSKLSSQSTSQYLSALAISDTVFLFQLLAPWLSAVQLNDLFLRKGFCQLFVYVAYVTSCLSAWLVVAFTVERFVAVLYPLQRNAICTVTRARHIILSIVVAAVLLNVPVLRFAKATTNDCNVDQDYMDYAARFNLVDTVVTFSAPLTVIVIMNTWIMIGVWRLERARHLMMRAEQPQPAVGQSARPPRLLTCPRSQQRVTRMLLIVSSVFVILNLPNYTMRMVAYAYGVATVENNDRWMALQQVSMMFFNTNFGINFILYCLSGQNFRRALRQTLPWLRRRARRGVAVRRAVSCHPARASSVSKRSISGDVEKWMNLSTASFVSNCTEATTNCPATVTTPSTRRRRREPFITRWTFDNSRQRHQLAVTTAAGNAATISADHFEMRAFPASEQI